MKKRSISILLTLCLVLVIAGCSNKTPTEGDGGAGTPGVQDGTGEDTDNSGGEEPTGVAAFPLDGLVDENGFFTGVTASEFVTLPEYKGVALPPETLTASDEDINEVVASFLAQYPKYEQITDRAVEDGDTVNIDYTGYVDGEAFQGGSTGGSGQTVTIGVDQFIDDFLEQLIDHTPGENYDIEVTFPDPYQNNPDLAGKDATFNVTINYIQGDKLERELDDAFAIEAGFDNREAVLAYIEERLIETQKEDFVNGILGQTQCSQVPEQVITAMEMVYLKSVAAEAASYGWPTDAYLAYALNFESQEQYLEAVSESLHDDALMCLAVQAIAEKENLSVTDQDITDAGYEPAVEYFGLEYVKFIMLRGTIVRNFILDNAA